jgi:L-gulonolactone oxidase
VAFEIHIAVEKKATIEQWSDVYDEIVQMTLQKYNGRPHWAKNSDPYFLKLGAAQFPQWQTFQSKRAELDPENVFQSDLWAKIGASEQNLAFTKTPACGVDRTCICSLESTTDCGPKARCEEGGFFKEARVCREN